MNKIVFTDDDLKRLNGLIEMGATSITVHENKLPTLLVRLEAAENPNRQKPHNIKTAVLEDEDDIHASDCDRCKADKAWRKSAGK